MLVFFFVILVFFFVMLVFSVVMLVFFFVMLVLGCALSIPKHKTQASTITPITKGLWWWWWCQGFLRRFLAIAREGRRCSLWV